MFSKRRVTNLFTLLVIAILSVAVASSSKTGWVGILVWSALLLVAGRAFFADEIWGMEWPIYGGVQGWIGEALSSFWLSFLLAGLALWLHPLAVMCVFHLAGAIWFRAAIKS